MKFLRFDLHQDRDNKNNTEDCGADKVAGARGADKVAGALGFGSSFAKPRHGDSIAAGFAERCCKDLNNPE